MNEPTRREDAIRRYGSLFDGTAVTEQQDVIEAAADLALRIAGEAAAVTPTNPGSVPSDPMAVERLRTLLSNAVLIESEYGNDDPQGLTEAALAKLPTATFIHDVNSAGVPMRRVVAYGEWEMDPNPPKVVRPAAPHTHTEYVLRDDYEALLARYDIRDSRLRALLEEVGPDGDGEDGWSKHAIDRVREAYTGRSMAEHEAGKRPGGDYDGPRRDDAVAAWLKSKRDEYDPACGGAYDLIDNLLDDYRLHADTGASLSTPTDELGPHGGGV